MNQIATRAQVVVDVRTGDDIPALPFVGAAYGLIWLALLSYVLLVARGLHGVRREIDEIKKRLASGGGTGGAGG